MHEEDHHELENETPEAPRPAGGRILSRLLKIEPGEGQVLAFACAYFFCVLCAYYLIRPIRDAMGVAGGIENLKWLYLGTLTGTLMGSVAFAAIAARYSRRRFIPFVYRFFIANLVIFFVLIRTVPESGQVNLGRAFFVWVSVFVMFVVSVFWSFMADVFTNPQGKRLFAFRQDKYKSKNVIDTFVYRLGDQVGVWAQTGLASLGAAAVAFGALPLAGGWFFVALWLGRRQRSLAARPASSP